MAGLRRLDPRRLRDLALMVACLHSQAVRPLRRYLATPTIAKHRLFV